MKIKKYKIYQKSKKNTFIIQLRIQNHNDKQYYYFIIQFYKNLKPRITYVCAVKAMVLPSLLLITSDSFRISSVGVGAGGRGLLLPVVIFEYDLKCN